MINGSYFFGSNKINLENETKSFKNFNFEELFKKTGIRFIYRANENETSLSLAVNAVNKLQENINSKEIDSLIFVSQSPVSTIPSAGSLLHKQLGLKNECFVLDIVQGCSGFPYALSIAVNFLKNKQFKNCLIVCSETYTKYIDKSDRISMPIFSDAASAIFIDQDTAPKMLSSYFLTDGNGAKNLCLKNNNNKSNLFMHGANVFTFTASKVPYATNYLLEKANLKLNDIKFFFYHQASAIVLNTIRKELDIPKEIFFYDIESMGNTVSSTIPISLILSEKKKNIPRKQPILMMGFGVGYSLSGGIFKFV